MLKVASKIKEINGITEKDLVKMGFNKLDKKYEASFCDRFGIDEGTINIYASFNDEHNEYDMAYGVKKGEKDLTMIL